MWEQQQNTIVHGEPTLDMMDVTNSYMEWYQRITRLLIGPPMPRPDVGFQLVGKIIELLEQTLTQIYHTGCDIVRNQPDLRTCLEAISWIRDVSYNCLSSIFEHRKLVQIPIDIQQPSVAAPVPARQRGVCIPQRSAARSHG